MVSKDEFHFEKVWDKFKTLFHGKILLAMDKQKITYAVILTNFQETLQYWYSDAYEQYRWLNEYRNNNPEKAAQIKDIINKMELKEITKDSSPRYVKEAAAIIATIIGFALPQTLILRIIAAVLAGGASFFLSKNYDNEIKKQLIDKLLEEYLSQFDIYKKQILDIINS